MFRIETYQETYLRSYTEFAHAYQQHFPESTTEEFILISQTPITNPALASSNKYPKVISDKIFKDIVPYIERNIYGGFQDQDLMIQMGIFNSPSTEDNIPARKLELKALFTSIESLGFKPDSLLTSYLFAIRALSTSQQLSIEKLKKELEQLAVLTIKGRNHETFLRNLAQRSAKYFTIANNLASGLFFAEIRLSQKNENIEGIDPEGLDLWLTLALLEMSKLGILHKSSTSIKNPLAQKIYSKKYDEAWNFIIQQNQQIPGLVNPVKISSARYHISNHLLYNQPNKNDLTF